MTSGRKKSSLCPGGLAHVHGVGLNGVMSEPGPAVQRPSRQVQGARAVGDAVVGVAHVDLRAGRILYKKTDVIQPLRQMPRKTSPVWRRQTIP